MSLFDLNVHQMVCSKGDFTSIYIIQQINGQLIATFKHVNHPKRGTEIFIKKLPRDILLQEILEFAVQCGDIYRIRLLMDFSGYNRGYCFVTYFDSTSARKAVLTLNGEKIKEDYNVLVKISFDNNKLEMRGIPPEINRDQIFAKISEIIGNGLKGVITFNKPKEKQSNPNEVCVLKYDTHRHALEARKKVWPRIKIWGKTMEIDWAVPHEVLNSKRLYFRKAPANLTKLELYDEVTKHVQPDIMLNIFLQGGLGYLLFSNGSVAFDAYLKLRSKKIGGKFLEYSFTKFYYHLDDEDKSDTLEEDVSYQTASEYMNGSEFAEPSWECLSSSVEEASSSMHLPLVRGINSSFDSTSLLDHTTTAYSDFEKDLSGDRPILQQKYGQLQNTKQLYPNIENAQGIAASSRFTENTANRNIGMVDSFPSVVIPPPILTLPGPYDEVAEIHHCVSHYFNFNHPTLRWIYTCTNEEFKQDIPVRNMIRILPAVNRNQYDLTLIQVPRTVE